MGQTLSCLGAGKSHTRTKSGHDDHRGEADNSKVKPWVFNYLMPLKQPLSDLWRAQTRSIPMKLCAKGCDSEGMGALPFAMLTIQALPQRYILFSVLTM